VAGDAVAARARPSFFARPTPRLNNNNNSNNNDSRHNTSFLREKSSHHSGLFISRLAISHVSGGCCVIFGPNVANLSSKRPANHVFFFIIYKYIIYYIPANICIFVTWCYLALINEKEGNRTIITKDSIRKERKNNTRPQTPRKGKKRYDTHVHVILFLRYVSAPRL